jgi:hypothetical protein
MGVLPSMQVETSEREGRGGEGEGKWWLPQDRRGDTRLGGGRRLGNGHMAALLRP